MHDFGVNRSPSTIRAAARSCRPDKPWIPGPLADVPPLGRPRASCPRRPPARRRRPSRRPMTPFKPAPAPRPRGCASTSAARWLRRTPPQWPGFQTPCSVTRRSGVDFGMKNVRSSTWTGTCLHLRPSSSSTRRASSTGP